MYGSIRVLCAATTELGDFPSNGIQWGDLGEGTQFRHAGLAEDVMKIVPNALYAGRDPMTVNEEVAQGSRQANGRRRRSLTAVFESGVQLAENNILPRA